MYTEKQDKETQKSESAVISRPGMTIDKQFYRRYRKR